MIDSNEINYDSLWVSAWGDQQKYGPIHRHQRRILKSLLRYYDFETVLDLGCGEGSNLLYVLKEFPAVTRAAGVDVSAEALEQAREILPSAELSVLDAQARALDETFDVVYSSDVIEHVPDDRSFLANAFKMTGKVFLVGTLQGKMRAFEKRTGHLRNYAPGELRRKCEEVGFSVTREIQWGWPLYSPFYRDLNDTDACQDAAAGRYGGTKIALCAALYYLFHLNSSRRGDIVWLACEKG